MQPDRRLCDNAAHERTFAPVPSRSPSHVRFAITIARLRRFVTASALIQHPAWPRIPQHRWASRPINRHSPEDSHCIRALRGFLPSGLFNACPHAPSRASKPADMGRRRTNLKMNRHRLLSPDTDEAQIHLRADCRRRDD